MHNQDRDGLVDQSALLFSSLVQVAVVGDCRRDFAVDRNSALVALACPAGSHARGAPGPEVDVALRLVLVDLQR